MVSAFKRGKTLLAGFLVLVFTIVAVGLIYSTEPTAQKEGATKRTAMLVDVITAQSGDFTPSIKAMGVVKPAKAVDLKPQVSGVVVAVSDKFVPGNFLSQGQWLVQLETEDFELAVRQAEAELERVEAAHAIEMGEQAVAQEDFARLGRDVSSMNEALILRKPQKQQVEADLKAARAVLEEAKLALKRTRITMPFDGQVMTQHVNLGSHLSPGDTITRIVGVHQYWIEASLPLSQLRWIASADEQLSDISHNVKIRNRSAWPADAHRNGFLKQVIAELDPATRMVRVLVAVDDPLALQQPQRAAQSLHPPLIAGSYVEVELPMRKLTSTVRIPLEYIRKQGTVWVMDKSKLDIRDIELAFKDEQYAYIQNGVQNGEAIITTNLASIKQGAQVRLRNSTQNLAAQSAAQ